MSQVGDANNNYRTGHCTGKLSPTYNSWRGAKERCTSKKHKNYELYKDLWCREWDSFSKFLEDMGERPEGMEIDRIDGSKPYSKENCRWADARTQLYNRTCTRRFPYNGKQCTALEIVELSGLAGHVTRKQMFNLLRTSMRTAEECVQYYKQKFKMEYGYVQRRSVEGATSS